MVKTVAYEEFRNEYRALTKEIRRLSDDRIEAYELPTWGNPNATIQLGLNWSACGTKTVEQTEDFVTALQTAIEMVKNFKYNGYKIVEG